MEDYKISKSKLRHTIKACLDNGERILSDALMLEFSNPPATPFFLVIIAEEEFAKAFLLTLVYKSVIPWNKYIWRATRDHVCKQLLIMVMDYMNPDWDEFMERIKALQDGHAIDSFPSHVADALNIFRHEKIRRWESQSWVWAEDPEYNLIAKKVAKGKLDKLKQEQLYTDIKKDGSFAPKSVLSQKKFEDERHRAERLCSLIQSMLNDDEKESLVYQKVLEAFKILFSNMFKGNNGNEP